MRWHLVRQAGAVKARAPRRKMLIRARLKAPDGWHDVCIVNLSHRGVGLQAADPPPRGGYVEIRHGSHVIIARVVWRQGHRFGVRAQDDIPLHLPQPPGTPRDRPDCQPVERRRAPRALADRAEASRNWGRRLQFGLAAVAGMAGALIAGAGVRDALAAPFAQVGNVLER